MGTYCNMKYRGSNLYGRGIRKERSPGSVAGLHRWLLASAFSAVGSVYECTGNGEIFEKAIGTDMGRVYLQRSAHCIGIYEFSVLLKIVPVAVDFDGVAMGTCLTVLPNGCAAFTNTTGTFHTGEQLLV